MKNHYLSSIIIILLFNFNEVNAQVGVGTTTPNGALDITSTTNGVVVPNIALTSRAVSAPVVNPNGGGAPAIGTLIWNTASTSLGTSNDVKPGFYYWDGSIWIAIAGDGSKNWSVTGNSGTTISNYIGTSDSVDLKIATNATEKMRVLSNGQVVINNTAAPTTGDQFSVYSSTYAINGYTTGSSQAAVYGNSSASLARGVYGNVSASDAIGVRAKNTSTTGTGLLASGNNTTSFTMPAGSGLASNGDLYGSVSFGNNTTSGWGIATSGNALPSISTITGGGGGAFSGYQWGVFGNATISGSGATDRAAFIGNFNENTTARTVYLGARIGGTNYKVLGTGSASVSTTMTTRDGERILFAPEAPENWFFDIGEVTLVNGKATVNLDPIFVDCISDSKPFKVFVQGGENTLGSIRITRNQNEKSFLVEDLGGNSNGTVQYSVYAIWKQKENLRFPKYHQPFTLQEIKKIQVNENH